MEALERQIGENSATVRAPANWIADAQREYPTRRRVSLREAIELLAIVSAAVAMAMVF